MTPHLADTPVLETGRLSLRAPVAADYPVWEAFFLSARGRFIGGGPDLHAGRAWRSFASVTGHWALRGCGPFVLVSKDTDAPLGACGPWYPALWPEREIGWSVWDPAAEGRGLMHEAAAAIVAHVYADLGWDTTVSYIDATNTRSAALAERLGASVDPDADLPPFENADEVRVYRHPAPGTCP